MSIDIERLKVDREHWEAVAPKGATHCIRNRGYGAEGVTWFKRCGHMDWKVWSRYETYQELRWCDSPGTSDGPQFIPRPEPRQVEWDGKGLPPVGCECEMRTTQSDWLTATVRYVSTQGCVVALSQGIEAFVTADKGPQFRPIRTKEQRERDDLAGMIEALNQSSSGNLADAIIAAGWRKEDNA